MRLIAKWPHEESHCYTVFARLSHRGPSTDRYDFDALHNPLGVPGSPLVKPESGWELCTALLELPPPTSSYFYYRRGIRKGKGRSLWSNMVPNTALPSACIFRIEEVIFSEMRKQVPLKRWYLCTRPHGDISQRTVSYFCENHKYRKGTMYLVECLIYT
jgi:hypothetical protein